MSLAQHKFSEQNWKKIVAKPTEIINGIAIALQF